jgi:lipoprotein-anchoring transpeptidase ErfK/SrfK
MRATLSLAVVWAAIACAVALPVASAQASPGICSTVLGRAAVGGPRSRVAWRAAIETRTPVFDLAARGRRRASGWVAPADAPWLLIVARPRPADHRCWVEVRLPWRPNDAAGWVNASRVLVQPTQWRIVVSTARRTLTLLRAGVPLRIMSVVVGKPSTPTPVGLFAVTWPIPWNANAFLGSWVLELTAHSDALQRFDGGDGTVGLHGRGGASLVDPLGSASSHGCVRLANGAIDWLVRTVGANRLPGTPVQVT